MNPHTVYLKEKIAPGGVDWMHFFYMKEGLAGIRFAYYTYYGQMDEIYFPIHSVEKIMYNNV